MKRIVVSVVGGTILLCGFVLLVLPGPAFLVIPIGLAVLATEYVWARRWLRRAKNMTNQRKAKRTSRALRQAFARRWSRWRQVLTRWRGSKGGGGAVGARPGLAAPTVSEGGLTAVRGAGEKRSECSLGESPELGGGVTPR